MAFMAQIIAPSPENGGPGRLSNYSLSFVGIQSVRIVVAVPVASKEACNELGSEADETVCAATPEPFPGVGRWYQDFSQTSDDEVHELLAQARASATS